MKTPEEETKALMVSLLNESSVAAERRLTEAIERIQSETVTAFGREFGSRLGFSPDDVMRVVKSCSLPALTRAVNNSVR